MEVLIWSLFKLVRIREVIIVKIKRKGFMVRLEVLEYGGVWD